jgi:hypothetical protein
VAPQGKSRADTLAQINRPRPPWFILVFSSPDASITEVLMWDVIMVAIGIGLFALSIGYAYACDRL